MTGVSHPVAMHGLVVNQEAEGLIRIPSVIHPVYRFISNEVSDISLLPYRITRLQDKIGIVVITLTWHYFPVVKASRQTFQMPFAYNRRLVPRLTEQFGIGYLCGVKHTGGVIKEAIGTAVLSRQDTGATWTAQ